MRLSQNKDKKAPKWQVDCLEEFNLKCKLQVKTEKVIFCSDLTSLQSRIFQPNVHHLRMWFRLNFSEFFETSPFISTFSFEIIKSLFFPQTEISQTIGTVTADSRLILGPTSTTTTTTIAMAQNIPDIECLSTPATATPSSRKSSLKREKKQKSIKMRKSSSGMSPNSDEISRESMEIEREQRSCGDTSTGRALSMSQCAMCGTSLSKSASQASNFSNIIIDKASDAASVRTSASARTTTASAQPTALGT